jgi:UDP-N-acetylglucosamine 4,6-dehydratase
MPFDGKTILVTGGTGSFGQHFVKTVLARYHPRAVRIFSRDELKQHEMRETLQDGRLRYFIGDVRDKERLSRALTGAQIVVHAAALKQIPACEYNPFEAVQTNVLGAQNLINTAIDAGVERVLALSSDKAVNPVNLYGATKLCADKLFIQGNSYTGAGPPKFACVRYGNVLGSRGSVIPLFREQRKSGMMTITDRRMTRFWITLDQAVEFVIRSIERMQGGEIFIPKIPSMALLDLVQAIAPGCQIRETGIRPGEKLHEILLTEDDARHALEFEDYFLIEPEFPWWGGSRWTGGKPLPEGFSYRSDNNPQWLTIEALTKLI